jgi:hypothetical protein
VAVNTILKARIKNRKDNKAGEGPADGTDLSKSDQSLGQGLLWFILMPIDPDSTF